MLVGRAVVVVPEEKIDERGLFVLFKAVDGRDLSVVAAAAELVVIGRAVVEVARAECLAVPVDVTRGLVVVVERDGRDVATL